MVGSIIQLSQGFLSHPLIGQNVVYHDTSTSFSSLVRAVHMAPSILEIRDMELQPVSCCTLARFSARKTPYLRTTEKSCYEAYVCLYSGCSYMLQVELILFLNARLLHHCSVLHYQKLSYYPVHHGFVSQNAIPPPISRLSLYCQTDVLCINSFLPG